MFDVCCRLFCPIGIPCKGLYSLLSFLTPHWYSVDDLGSYIVKNQNGSDFVDGSLNLLNLTPNREEVDQGKRNEDKKKNKKKKEKKKKKKEYK